MVIEGLGFSCVGFGRWCIDGLGPLKYRFCGIWTSSIEGRYEFEVDLGLSLCSRLFVE